MVKKVTKKAGDKVPWEDQSIDAKEKELIDATVDEMKAVEGDDDFKNLHRKDFISRALDRLQTIQPQVEHNDIKIPSFSNVPIGKAF